MLVEFMGVNLLKKDNQTKLEELIFSRIESKDDFYYINQYLKTIENYSLRKFLFSKLLKSYFEKFNLVYEGNVLQYGEEKIKLDIDNDIFDSLIDLLEETEVDGETLFYLFSDDLGKRVEVLKTLLKDRSKKQWSEEELVSFLNNLTPLTKEFLKLVTEKGKIKTEDITQILDLKSKKSVSALVSAVSRNAPIDKEKLIFKDNDYITINEKYRDKIYRIFNK
ncbi:MAG TPA: hypothetical protein PK894_06075 [Defluviitoga sp.]|nr:hypothetical protein [Defluviitoga sp.]HOP24044.1 hypothetical protein [Defluviitoga sp.]HPZ29254.1 hypothetical protein [Defluviitoga sp.]HQD63142.1 hypothetical protein [Defluviitoga sp.]